MYKQRAGHYGATLNNMVIKPCFCMSILRISKVTVRMDWNPGDFCIIYK